MSDPRDNRTTQIERRCVTRIEIADHVEAAFSGSPVHRDELCERAAKNSARPAALAVLEMLPDRYYRRLADLWADIPAIPVDDEPR